MLFANMTILLSLTSYACSCFRSRAGCRIFMPRILGGAIDSYQILICGSTKALINTHCTASP